VADRFCRKPRYASIFSCILIFIDQGFDAAIKVCENQSKERMKNCLIVSSFQGFV
jgi:hypothetical protein